LVLSLATKEKASQCENRGPKNQWKTGHMLTRDEIATEPVAALPAIYTQRAVSIFFVMHKPATCCTGLIVDKITTIPSYHGPKAFNTTL
jgi:hypothetical protein